MTTPTIAYLTLTSMYSHRGDGIPTQYTHSDDVRAHAETLYHAHPKWFGEAVALCLLTNQKLVLSVEQITELRDAVLQPCWDCCNEQNCTTCYNMGHLPR